MTEPEMIGTQNKSVVEYWRARAEDFEAEVHRVIQLLNAHHDCGTVMKEEFLGVLCPVCNPRPKSEWRANPDNFDEVVEMAAAAGGGVIYLEPGKYHTVTSVGLIPDNVHLIGPSGARGAEFRSTP